MGFLYFIVHHLLLHLHQGGTAMSYGSWTRNDYDPHLSHFEATAFNDKELLFHPGRLSHGKAPSTPALPNAPDHSKVGALKVLKLGALPNLKLPKSSAGTSTPKPGSLNKVH